MTKFSFKFNGFDVDYSIASEWKELTKKQVEYIAKNLPTYRKLYFALQNAIDKKKVKQADEANGMIQRHRIFLFTFLADINLTRAHENRTRAFLALENDELSELLETVNFVFREVGAFDYFFPMLEINGV